MSGARGTAAVRLLVSGRVQGVGFRWFTKRAARALGLAGFVRNLPDGRVEVVASGPVDAVEKLVQTVQVGPGGAAVTEVERQAVETEHEGAGCNPFAVR